MSIGLINYLLVSVLTTIANKIAPSNTIALIDHGFCSRVNRVLFEILINYLLVSVLTPIAINEIAPGNTGVDSSQDYSRVLTLIVTELNLDRYVSRN